MWPMLLDYSDEECRKILRKLELEAYASVISAFRAQGELTKEKKKMLQELSTALSIPMERHRAEIRRAVNDEHLNTVAERLCGPNTTTDWAIEGRRVIPLMPRLVPQTAFTVMANYAADAQAAKNATLPVPSATGLKDGYQSETEENTELSRKRAHSPVTNVIPEKYLALDHSPVSSSSLVEHEESNEPFTNSNSPVPQCAQPSFASKETLFPKTNAVSSKPPVSTPSSPPSKVVTSNCSGSPLLPSKSTNNQVAKSTPSTTSAPPTTKPTVVNSVSSTEASVVPSTSSQSCSVPNSTSGSFYSTAGGPTQTSNSISVPVTSGLVPKTQSKVLLTKPLMRPRLFSGNMSSASQSITYQGSSPQLPSPNLVQPLHKTVTSIKSRPPTKIPSCNITSPTVQQSTVTAGQIGPRVQSPVTSISRVTLSATTVSQSVSSLTLKHTQPSMALTTPTKSNVTPKVLSKPATLRPPLGGPRTVLTCVAKAPTLKSSCVAITTAPSRQPVPISVVKTSVPLQLLSTAKSSPSLTYSTKVLLSPGQGKPTNQTVAKTIHYRNEGGLKIISQNLTGNRILPKPSSSLTSQSSTNPTRVATTTSTIGTARIVNFSQPFNTRFSRALPSSSSIAAVNLVNSLPVTGLRVALPVNNSSMMRTALPAKPNVIVVHKAQVWPQSPGATIVMTSTGSLSRIATEALKKPQRIADRNSPLTLASENFTSFPKIESDSLVTMKQSMTTITPTTAVNKISENAAKKDETTPSNNPVPDKINIISSEAKPVKASKEEAKLVSEVDEVAKDEPASAQESGNPSLADSSHPKSTVPEEKSKKHDLKEGLSSSLVNIQNLNLDHLQEGQVLELQPEDAAELLSQHGQLSTEVIELLQQAGLQMDVSDQDANLSASETMKLHFSEPGSDQSDGKPRKQIQLNVNANTKEAVVKSVRAESPAESSEEVKPVHMNDTMDNENQEKKPEPVSRLLKCNSESHNATEETSHSSGGVSDAEASNESPTAERKAEPEAAKSSDPSQTSRSLLNSLVVRNVTVEIESLDPATLNLTLPPKTGVR